MRSQKKYRLYKSRKSRKSRNKKRIRKHKLYGGKSTELTQSDFMVKDFTIKNSVLYYKNKKITDINPVVLDRRGVDRGLEVYKSGNFSTNDKLTELLEDLILQLDKEQYSSIKVTYED